MSWLGHPSVLATNFPFCSWLSLMTVLPFLFDFVLDGTLTLQCSSLIPGSVLRALTLASAPMVANLKVDLLYLGLECSNEISIFFFIVGIYGWSWGTRNKHLGHVLNFSYHTPGSWDPLHPLEFNSFLVFVYSPS